jgi:hypothetical protein
MTKFERVCTVYPRPASLQINSSKNALLSEATTNASTLLVYGVTCGVTFTFCLVFNNFGIKTTSMANMKHLISSLQEYYSIAVDWTGSLLCSVKLMWDYIM